MQDRYFRWMLCLLVSLLLLIAFLFFYPPAAQPTAAPHPQFDSILQRTDPYDALSYGLGLLFGLLLIASIALTFSIGLHRKGRTSKLNTGIVSVFFFYALIWVLIKVANDVYLDGQSPAYFGGFPFPTAMLVYGIGALPLVLIPVYFFTFERDIFSAHDQARFDALKSEQNDTGEART